MPEIRDKYDTYKDFEEGEQLSPLSPEAYYAELAWNYAFRKAYWLAVFAYTAETSMRAMVSFLREECDARDTHFDLESEDARRTRQS